jgi:hypothetical protein
VVDSRVIMELKAVARHRLPHPNGVVGDVLLVGIAIHENPAGLGAEHLTHRQIWRLYSYDGRQAGALLSVGVDIRKVRWLKLDEAKVVRGIFCANSNPACLNNCSASAGV